MKLTKSLLAVAVLGSIASTTAWADTTVTLYGLLDTGLEYQNAKVGSGDSNYAANGSGSKSSIGMGTGLESESRWGMKGSEDLGGGLQANFVIESGFSSSDGTNKGNESGRLFGRQATVGLSAPTWGSVDLGRNYTVSSNYLGDIDPFGTDFMQASMGTTFSAANTVRYDNEVMYQTPTWGGFNFALAYSFNYDNTLDTGYETNDKNRAVSAGLKYVNGPFEVVGTYDQQFLYQEDGNPKEFIVGANYDFTVAKLALAYSRTKDGVLSGQAYNYVGGATIGDSNTNSAFSESGLSINSYMVGVSVPVTANTNVFGSYQYADANKGLANTSVASVGTMYNLSKRTNLYAYVSYGNNVAYVNDDRATIVAAGIRHQF